MTTPQFGATGTGRLCLWNRLSFSFLNGARAISFKPETGCFILISWCLVVILKMKCDQDLCLTLWYDLKKLLWQDELNPRVRCAFGNVLYFCWCYFSCFFQVCRLEVNRKVICYYTSTLPPNYYGLIHRGCFRLSTIIEQVRTSNQLCLPQLTIAANNILK